METKRGSRKPPTTGAEAAQRIALALERVADELEQIRRQRDKGAQLPLSQDLLRDLLRSLSGRR